MHYLIKQLKRPLYHTLLAGIAAAILFAIFSILALYFQRQWIGSCAPTNVCDQSISFVSVMTVVFGDFTFVARFLLEIITLFFAAQIIARLWMLLRSRRNRAVK